MEWLRQQAGVSPAAQALWGWLNGIISNGEMFKMEDYRQDMIAEQESWQWGGAVSRRYEIWRELFPKETFLVRELKDGIHWTFGESEEAWKAFHEACAKRRGPQRLSEERRRSVREVKEEFVHHGVLGLQTEPEKEGFVATMFPQTKTDGGLRWLVDMSEFNDALTTDKYKTRGMKELQDRLPRGAWICALDFKWFYYLFYMHPAMHRFQRVWIERELYEFKTVVMGSRPSAHRTTEYPRTLLDQLTRLGGIEALQYLDEIADWVTAEEGRPAAYIQHAVLLLACHMLGLVVSWKKDVFMPEQQLTLLGWVTDSMTLRITPTEQRVREIREMAQQMSMGVVPQGGVTIRYKSRFAGKVAAMALGTWKAGLWGAWLKRELREELRRWGGNYDAVSPYDDAMRELYGRIANSELEEWWNYLRFEVPTEVITTDASEYAWGGHRTRVTESGTIIDLEHRGFFTPEERRFHHNAQEQLGADHYFLWFLETTGVQGTVEQPVCIVAETDNKTIEAAQRRLRTRSVEVASLMLRSCERMFERHVQRMPRLIGKAVMDGERQADAASREHSRWYEWMLKPAVFERMCKKLKVDTQDVIDLFAQPETTQVALERSVVYDHHPLAMWTDAFTASWSADSNDVLEWTDVLYMFPPPRLLPRVQQRWLEIEESEEWVESAVLVIPVHPQHSWFRFFVQRMVAKAVVLPSMTNILVPPEGRREAKDAPPEWSWIGLKLSTNTERRQAFRERRSVSGDVSIQMQTRGSRGTSGRSSSIAKVKEAIREAFQMSR